MANFDRKLELWRLLRGAPDGVGLMDLAARLGVSKNTVQRDIDELSRAGVPVEERQHGQAFRFVVRDAAPPPLAAGLRELAALQAAETLLAPYRGLGLARSLRAVRARLESPGPASVPAMFEGPRARSAGGARADVVDALLRAVAERRRCRITYTPRRAAEARIYEVEPHSIFLAGGLAYLVARTPPHRGPTTFALHLLSAAELLETRFRRRRWKRTGFQVFEEEPRRVVVRFAPEVAAFITERIWHPTQRLSRRPDGTVEFRARLSGQHEFLGWVLSWSPYAELVAPRAWRRGLLERASKMAERHRTAPRPAAVTSEDGPGRSDRDTK